MDSLTLDLETRRLATEVGGWDALKRGEGGISALVLWRSEVGYPHLSDDNDLEEAVSIIENTPVIITFNGVGFDIPIIEGRIGHTLHLQSHIDLLQCIWEALYHRNKGKSRGYSLDAVASRTLGRRKTGSGALAPTLAEQGRWGGLFNYCLHDVLLTRDLAHFVQKHGGIVDTDGELLPLTMPAWYDEVTF